MPDDREAKLRRLRELVNATRVDGVTPPHVFEALEIVAALINELSDPADVPTNPGRRMTPQPFRASDVTRILDEGKGKR